MTTTTTTTVLVLTCVLLVAGASCGPVAAATSTLDRPRISADAVYPPPAQSRTRRHLYGHLLTDLYDADYN